MKKIFMLLAVAGMFGVTSCGGGDVCDCLTAAAADTEAQDKCWGEEEMFAEDKLAKIGECADAAAEGEGEEGGEESH